MRKYLSFLKNPMFKMISILSVLLFLYVSVCAVSYAKSVSTNISESVFRLHVIANSDSQEDQDLKYKVRDKLIEYMNSKLRNTTTKEEAMEIVKNNLESFKEIAQKVVADEGYKYIVNVKVGNFEFPTKHYGDISLPAGNYDALRVEIGEAKGQNWWCVMFPPLCFVDVTSGIVPEESKMELKNNLDDEEYALISSNKSNDIEFKFKLLEWFGNNDLITAKK